METKSTATIVAKKKKASAKKPMAVKMAMPIASNGMCKTCNLLPVGSIEMASLLLVLVFSLVSVLFTAVFALNAQQNKISDLEELISSS
ncbi:MAG: hypothetical protein AAB337_02910 [Patescibacteria group bacterium]